MTTFQENELEWLYYQLWTKADSSPQKFSFIIPDTITFKNGKPQTWYFSTLKDGTVLKKNFKNVTAKKIWNMMIKPGHSDGVASATTYTYANEKTILDAKNNIESQRNYLLLEHFTMPELCGLLFSQAARRPYTDLEDHGIITKDQQSIEAAQEYVDPTSELNVLQRFVIPRGGHNQLIRMNWTPHGQVGERVTNKLNQNDESQTVEAKTVTYEGIDMYCKRETIAPQSPLFNHLTKAMWQIYNHIKRNSGMKLLSGQFFFKIDANNNLNLIFAKSLKTDAVVPILRGEPIHLGLTQLSSFLYPSNQTKKTPAQSRKEAQLNLQIQQNNEEGDLRPGAQVRNSLPPIQNSGQFKLALDKDQVDAQEQSIHTSQKSEKQSQMLLETPSQLVCPFTQETILVKETDAYEVTMQQIVRLYDYFEQHANQLQQLVHDEPNAFFEDLYSQITCLNAHSAANKEGQQQSGDMSQRVPRPIVKILGEQISYETYCQLQGDVQFMTKFVKVSDESFKNIRILMRVMNPSTFEESPDYEHKKEDQAGEMTETVNEDDFTNSDEEGVIIKSDNEPSFEVKQEKGGFSFARVEGGNEIGASATKENVKSSLPSQCTFQENVFPAVSSRASVQVEKQKNAFIPNIPSRPQSGKVGKHIPKGRPKVTRPASHNQRNLNNKQLEKAKQVIDFVAYHNKPVVNTLEAIQKQSFRPASGRTQQQYETIASSNKAKEHWVRVRAEEQAPVVTRPHIASAVNRLEKKNKKRQYSVKNAKIDFNSRSENEFGAYEQRNMDVAIKSMKRPSIENMPEVDYTSFGNLTESEFKQRAKRPLTAKDMHRMNSGKKPFDLRQKNIRHSTEAFEEYEIPISQASAAAGAYPRRELAKIYLKRMPEYKQAIQNQPNFTSHRDKNEGLKMPPKPPVHQGNYSRPVRVKQSSSKNKIRSKNEDYSSHKSLTELINEARSKASTLNQMGLSPEKTKSGKSSKEKSHAIESGRSDKLTNIKVKTSSQRTSSQAKTQPATDGPNNHASEFSAMFGGVTDIRQIADNADNLIQIITQIKEMSQAEQNDGDQLERIEHNDASLPQDQNLNEDPSQAIKGLLISPTSPAHSIFEEGKSSKDAPKTVAQGSETKEWW